MSLHPRTAIVRRVLLVVSCLALAAVVGCRGPVGPFSGGRLKGPEGSFPGSWTHADEVMQIQLETNPSDPYSVNLWLAILEGDAYVSTSLLAGTDDPTQRAWVKNVQADPSVRVRIEDVVYPAELDPITDATLRDLVFEAFLEKYPHLELERAEAALYFRIAKRSDAAK